MRVLAFVVVLCMALCVQVVAAPLNKVVAVVNGDMISAYDLDRAVAPALLRAGLDAKADPEAVATLRRNVLESMINDLIVTQEAQRLSITVSDSEIDAELQQLRNQSKLSEADFAKQLAAQKMSLAEYREQIRKGLLTRQLLGHMVARKVVISKEEIEAYYNEHSDMFGAGRTVRFPLLIYPPESEPKKWADKLRSGKLDFEETVKKVSVGPMKEQGGDLGFIPWNDLAPDVKSQIGNLKQGEVTELFLLNGMPAQIKLLDSNTDGSTSSLEEVSGQIENILRQPKMQERLVEYMEQLRKRAVIDIRL